MWQTVYTIGTHMTNKIMIKILNFYLKTTLANFKNKKIHIRKTKNLKGVKKKKKKKKKTKQTNKQTKTTTTTTSQIFLEFLGSQT